jgi:hypothetical protein
MQLTVFPSEAMEIPHHDATVSGNFLLELRVLRGNHGFRDLLAASELLSVIGAATRIGC